MFTGTLLLPPPCFQLTRYCSCLKFGPVHFLPVSLDFIVNLMIDRLMLAERESELPTRSSYRVHQRQLKKKKIKSIVTVSYGGLNGGLRCEPKFTFGLFFGKTGCEMDITGEFQLQKKGCMTKRKKKKRKNKGQTKQTFAVEGQKDKQTR